MASLAHGPTEAFRCGPPVSGQSRRWTPERLAWMAVCMAVAQAAASVSSCGGYRRDGLTTRAPVTLRVAVDMPNLPGQSDVGVQQFLELVTGEPLVTLEPDGRPGPRLAESWQQSADGLTWWFHLRPGTRFHDGSPVTAEAARRSIVAAMSVVERQQLPPGLADVTGVEVKGPETLVIRLARPASLLPDDLSEIPITAANGARTGPFVVERRDAALTTLHAFEHYDKGVPAIDRIEVRPYPNVRTAWAAMLRGDADFLHEVSPDAMEFVKGVSSVQAFSFLRPYVYAIGFNVRHPVLHDPEVRRALSKAIDRQRVLDVAFRGHGKPADGHVSPVHWAYDPTAGGYRFDPIDASERLARAGYALPNIVRAGADEQPRRFRFTCLVLEGHPVFERVALTVQQQLFEIGVDMDIDAVPMQEFNRRVATGQFDAYLMYLAGRSLWWPYRFWHSPKAGRAWIDSGYRAADEVLDRIRSAVTDVEMRDAMSAFQRVMQLDPPAVFLCWEDKARAVSRRFVVPEMPDRDVIATLWQWRLRDNATESPRSRTELE